MTKGIIARDFEAVEVTHEGVQYFVDFTASASYWSTPGKLSGPPEDCYEADEGIEIDSIDITSVKDTLDFSIVLDARARKFFSLLVETDELTIALWEAIGPEEDDYDGDDTE